MLSSLIMAITLITLSVVMLCIGIALVAQRTKKKKEVM